MKVRLIRAAFAMYLTAWLAMGTPVLAQAQAQGQQSQAQTQAPSSSGQQNLSKSSYPNLLTGPNYSKGKRTFPNIFSPYFPYQIPEPVLTNSPGILALIHDGKLELSIDDAVALALENNLAIRVERYLPWDAQTDLLRTYGGGTPQGQFQLGSGGGGAFDPVIYSSASVADSVSPVNNPFTTGVGSSLISAFQSHQSSYLVGYSQAFHTGTSITAQFANTRSSTSASANLFNPSVQSTLSFSVSQPLLRGFGLLPNIKLILEAKNENLQDNLQFQEQVITTITQVETQYWDLVYARENVNVQKTAMASDQKLYEDNKRQLEIGTLAPLDVLTAQSAVATDLQNVIIAQTNQLQQETNLLNLITKNPMDAALQNVEIVPTTPISELPQIPSLTLPEAVNEAWQNRPELKFDQVGLNTDTIEIKATRNELLPSMTLSGNYQSTGLGGNSTIVTSTPTAFGPDLAVPILLNGTIVPNEFAGTPIAYNTTRTILPGGLGDAVSQTFHGDYPTYSASLSFSLPLRNRSAQADNARALLNDRQAKVSYLEDKNTIAVSVRNALIAIQQGQAQVTAAEKATELAQQSLTDEEKKYQLGASTSYNVVLMTRDLTAAQGAELQAKVNLEVAMVTFNQAMGRTLTANNITIADSQHPQANTPPEIPGTTSDRQLSNGVIGVQQ